MKIWGIPAGMMMRILYISILILTGITLFSGCGDSKPLEAGVVEFKGNGTVVGVDKGPRIVTIEHGKIDGLMGAMTMDFSVDQRDLLDGIGRGDTVEFTLRRKGEDLKLTSIRKTGKLQADGAEIFKTSCAKCHGAKGEGAKKGIPLIEGHALNHPEEDFLKQVKEGGKKMPEFGDKLSNEEIAAVVEYVRNEIQKGLRKEEGGGHKH